MFHFLVKQVKTGGEKKNLLAKYVTSLSTKKCCILFSRFFPFSSLSRLLDCSYAPGSAHYCDG